MEIIIFYMEIISLCSYNFGIHYIIEEEECDVQSTPEQGTVAESAQY